jgi:hypothetical protein
MTGSSEESKADNRARQRKPRPIIQRLMRWLYLFAAITLALMAMLIIAWAITVVVEHAPSLWHADAAGSAGASSKDFIGTMLQAAGAVVISVAILDVAKYMIEEEFLSSKELRSVREAREALTKITVIIAIAVGIEGLIYIFKAGATDISLLLYPAALILVAMLVVVGLGVFQKLSIGAENRDLRSHADE